MDSFLLTPLLDRFLREDLEHGDITTDAIFSEQDQATAYFIARHAMTVAGMNSVATKVFIYLIARCSARGMWQMGSRLKLVPGCLKLVAQPVPFCVANEWPLTWCKGSAALPRAPALLWTACRA